MPTLSGPTKEFEVDDQGFLTDSRTWDESFARLLAPRVGIPDGLTDRHWTIIHFIRQSAAEIGRCPLVYQTCKMNNLRLAELRQLFPTGYLRGACRLAGLTYADAPPGAADRFDDEIPRSDQKRSYEVDAHGFLIDADAWDDAFASGKAEELGMDILSDESWKIVFWLRHEYQISGRVPTVYETCEAHGLEFRDLENLFPTGYHRGAIKISGLRVR